MTVIYVNIIASRILLYTVMAVLLYYYSARYKMYLVCVPSRSTDISCVSQRREKTIIQQLLQHTEHRIHCIGRYIISQNIRHRFF